jgi:hypothetical protein
MALAMAGLDLDRLAGRLLEAPRTQGPRKAAKTTDTEATSAQPAEAQTATATTTTTTTTSGDPEAAGTPKVGCPRLPAMAISAIRLLMQTKDFCLWVFMSGLLGKAVS